MTIGGSNDAYLNSVELYNWKTGQQCFIEPLPQVNTILLLFILSLGFIIITSIKSKTTVQFTSSYF